MKLEESLYVLQMGPFQRTFEDKTPDFRVGGVYFKGPWEEL